MNVFLKLSEYNALYGFSFILTSIFSVLICYKIRMFYLQKPPLMLNITDLISGDQYLMHSASTVVTSTIIIIRLLTGPLDHITSFAMMIVMALIWGTTAVYISTLCIARYLMIFQYHFLNQVKEDANK